MMGAVLTRMLLTVGLVTTPPPVNQPAWELIRMHDHGGCDSMSAVVPLSRSDVWVFGQSEPIDDECAGTARPVAQHWDGRAWRAAELPGRHYGAIGSAGASSSDNVWAFTTSDTGESAALRYDGRRWTDAGRSAMGPRPNLSRGLVLGRHHVWAFGSDGHSASWFWNGRTWQRRAPRDVVRTSAVSQKDVWAIGCCQVTHFDGRAWKKAGFPAGRDKGTVSLTGILAVAKNDVWVFGDRDEKVFAAHFDGRAWSPVEVPAPAAPAWRLGDAVADGRGGIRVIADPPDDTSSRVLSRSAAGQWSVSTPQVAGKVIKLWDLALVPGTTEVWAAGTVRQSESDSTSAVFALR